MSHRYEEGADLDDHFDKLHEDWELSGFKASNALQLLRAVKECFKQMLQVRLNLTPDCFNRSAMHKQHQLGLNSLLAALIDCIHLVRIIVTSDVGQSRG